MKPLFLLLPLLAASCINLSWDVRHRDEPLPPLMLASLWPGTDDLDSCLRKLGAPHFVWEYRRDGCALGWYWVDEHAFGLRFSYQFARFTNVSFQWDDEGTYVPGVVLWFGPDLVLVRWRQGNLRELTAGLRARPAGLEDEDEDSGPGRSQKAQNVMNCSSSW